MTHGRKMQLASKADGFILDAYHTAPEDARQGGVDWAVSQGYTKTNLNGYEGTETLEKGAREAVRVALLGSESPIGTFTRWENETIPW
jgi:hypothetical protein